MASPAPQPNDPIGWRSRADAALDAGNWAEAIVGFERAAQGYESAAALQDAAICFGRLSDLHAHQQDYPSARAAALRALALFEQAEDRRGRSVALVALADYAMQSADWPEAQRFREAANAALAQQGDHYGLAQGLAVLGEILFQSSDRDSACMRFEEARALFERLGAQPEAASVAARRDALCADDSPALDDELLRSILINTAAVLGPAADRRDEWLTLLARLTHDLVDRDEQAALSLCHALDQLIRRGPGAFDALGGSISPAYQGAWAAMREHLIVQGLLPPAP